MNFRKLIMITTLTGLALTSCSKGKENVSTEGKEPAIDLKALDQKVTPGDDFYHFSNGGWMAANPLKPEYSRFGSFDILRDRSLDQIHQIVDDLVKTNPTEGTNEYRVATLYKQSMDSVTRNKLGAEPIRKDLEEIEAIKTKKQLSKKVAEWDNEGKSTLFSSSVWADDMDSEHNIMHLGQKGLPLGDKDYYLSDKEETKKILNAYNAYLHKILLLAGYSEKVATRIVKNNMKISKDIARMSSSRVELRNRRENYHMLPVADFVKSNRGFDWKTYLAVRELKALKKWNVSQLRFFREFNRWYPKVNLRQIKDFLIAENVDDAAGYLSDDFSNAAFEFYGKTLSGREKQHPRWRRAVNLVNGVLGEALGEVYVKKHFKPEAKEKMITLVKNLQVALGERINALEWMSKETKQRALDKLNNFQVKIGYPDKWKDYSKLAISANKNYVENLKEVSKFEHQRNMAELGKKVDRDQWLMNPQDVNAYYLPTTNEICFPAAILQPPFFNIDADDAVNYGAIGVVIGHEMTHGFDDQGRNYDKDGNMIDWWTAEDSKKFEAAASRLVDQFNALPVANDVMANGRLTLGENIADQGGLMIAFKAMKNAAKGKKIEAIDGFSPEQRFFIGYARVWGQNITEKEMINLTKLDPHSLGIYRVNQTLRNIDAFFDAFKITKTNKMWLEPKDRVLVW